VNRAMTALVVLAVAVVLYLLLSSFIFSGLTCGGTGCP
jgi:hypothetical protein